MSRNGKAPSASVQLQALLEEQGRLPGELRAAFSDGNNDEVLALRQRMDVLPGHIWATRGRALQERVAGLEREIERAEAAIPNHQLKLQAAEEVLKAATEKRNDARAAFWAVQGDMQSIQLDLRSAQRELGAHLNGIGMPGG